VALELRDVLPGRFGIEPAGELVAGVAAHGVEGQLVLQVDQRDREAAGAGRDEAVGRVPGADPAERQVLGGVDPVHGVERGVDAVGEGLQAGARASGHLLEVAPARRLEVQRTQEAVEVGDAPPGEELVAAGGRAHVADQLAQPRGAGVAQEVDQDEAVGRLQEAERGVEVALDVGVDVGDAVAVAHDLEPALEARQVGGGQGRPRARLAPARDRGDETPRHRRAPLARQRGSEAPRGRHGPE
jgi:hypothetical protein